MAINFSLPGQSRYASPPTAPTIDTLVFGRGSHLKFAEQATSGTAITAPADFSKYKVAINSMAVAPTTNLLTPGVIPVTVEQFKGVPGPLTIDGSFVMDALPERMEIFFRQLLNAPDVSDVTANPLLGSTSLATDTTSLTTQPDPPSRLVVTLSGTPQRGSSAISAANPITITFAGTDRHGNAARETLTFTDPTELVQSTTTSFSAVATDGVITNHASGAQTALTGNIAIADAFSGVSIASSTAYRLTPGLTVEAVMGTQDSAGLGGVPNTIIDAYLNTFSFNATREEIITYNFGLTGKTFKQNVAPNGTTTAFPDTRTGGTLYGSGNFATIQDDQTPLPGYGACLYIGDSTNRILFEGVLGLTLNFDNNTQFTPRLCDVQQGLAYNRQRTVGVEIELEYHSSDKEFATAYLQAEDWDDVEMVLCGVDGKDTRFKFDRIQLTEYPSMPVESDDFVRQTVRGMALPSSNSAADAITIECRSGNSKSALGLANLMP